MAGDTAGIHQQILPHRLLTTEHRFDPGGQFENRKRFGQIIIRSHLQPLYPLGFAGASADNNHRQIAGLLTNAPTNFQTVYARQHQVEDHRIPKLFFQQAQGLGSVRHVDNLITLIQQIQAQQRGDIFIIFNQQDFFCHRQHSAILTF